MSYLTTIRYNIFPCSKAQLIVIKKPINHRNPYKTLSQRANPSSRWSNFPANTPPKRPDPSSHWRNPLSQSLPSDPKHPAGGRILPPKIRSATQNIQSLEETGQSTAFQQTNPSSHWKNHPAHRPLSVLILPASGRIGTRRAIETQPARELHTA